MATDIKNLTSDFKVYTKAFTELEKQLLNKPAEAVVNLRELNNAFYSYFIHSKDKDWYSRSAECTAYILTNLTSLRPTEKCTPDKIKTCINIVNDIRHHMNCMLKLRGSSGKNLSLKPDEMIGTKQINISESAVQAMKRSGIIECSQYDMVELINGSF